MLNIPMYTAHPTAHSVFLIRDPRNRILSAIKGRVWRPSLNSVNTLSRCFRWMGPNSMRPLNVYKSVLGCSHSMVPNVCNLSNEIFHFICNRLKYLALQIILPKPTFGSPFGTINVFKLVSPSKLAVVIWHFEFGSLDLIKTKSHGTSQSLTAITISPCTISWHRMSSSTPLRTTVTEMVLVVKFRLSQPVRTWTYHRNNLPYCQLDAVKNLHILV